MSRFKDDAMVSGKLANDQDTLIYNLQAQLKNLQDDIQTQKANLLSQGRLLVEAREECDQLKAEVKKKKNRIGILNRSLRRLKKGGE